MRRILVVGGGGREHAIAWALHRSPSRPQVITAPGNPGTETIGPRISVRPERIEEVVDAARERQVDLVVVGPEGPLVAGLADRLRAAGIPVFGPSAAASRLEGSKSFARRFMRDHGIPGPEFWTFSDPTEAERHVMKMGVPLVVKADGLAAGKGVMVPDTVDETLHAIRRLMVDRRFGAAGAVVVLESRMSGPELSVTALTDGKRWVLLAPSRDHKRLGDGDRGPNTGGMGAIAPVPDVDDALLGEIEARVVGPAIEGMAARGTPFVGCLYAGLMLTEEGPRVLEFNCRFGDPEAQVVLSLFDGDLAELMFGAAAGELDPTLARVAEGAAATVVMASAGYPESSTTGVPISGLDEIRPPAVAFHAGTAIDRSGRLVTAGGRVLSLTARADTLDEALAAAYGAVDAVRFDGAQYRTDIGGWRRAR